MHLQLQGSSVNTPNCLETVVNEGQVVGSRPVKRKKNVSNKKRILCLFSTNCIETVNKLITNNVTVYSVLKPK